MFYPVPITTVQAVHNLLADGIRHWQYRDFIARRNQPVEPRDYSGPVRQETGIGEDAGVYVHQTAVWRAHLPLSVRFSPPSGYEEPSQLDKPETRRGSRLSAPDKRLDGCDDIEAAHGGHSDARIRHAQYVRISGLTGWSVINRPVTVNCTPTRNVPNNVSGMPPMAFQSPEGDTLDRVTTSILSLGELRQLRKYRNAMKGDKFAESMASEQRERDRAYWRAAYPYWPLNKDGTFKTPLYVKGVPLFDLGSGALVPLSDLIASWRTHNAEEVESIEEKRKRMSRKAELDALEAEQREDARDQRAREKRQRRAREEAALVTGKTLLRFRK